MSAKFIVCQLQRCLNADWTSLFANLVNHFAASFQWTRAVQGVPFGFSKQKIGWHFVSFKHCFLHKYFVEIDAFALTAAKTTVRYENA
jgi:hypothetical protein